MRLCFSATAVTDERVADRPSDEQSEERRVKPLLGGVLVWGFKQKVQRCSPVCIRLYDFHFFVAPFQPTALPRMAGPYKAFVLP